MGPVSYFSDGDCADEHTPTWMEVHWHPCRCAMYVWKGRTQVGIKKVWIWSHHEPSKERIDDDACSLDQVGAELSRMRQAAPLVHVLTNEVVQSLRANVLFRDWAAPCDDCCGRGSRSVCLDCIGSPVNIGTRCILRAMLRWCVPSIRQWLRDSAGAGSSGGGVLRYRTE